MLPPPPAAAGPPADAPVRIVTATGPFTCSDDLSYAPLEALLDAASKRGADALVLLGPFVDEANEALSSADLALTFNELFDTQVPHKDGELLDKVHTYDLAILENIFRYAPISKLCMEGPMQYYKKGQAAAQH